MQGRKHFTPQLFYELSLDMLVPEDNYYRKLLTELDLHFIYKSTQKYYGKEGQESIDSVVFFKILLVGYLNNINSDRQLIAFCSDTCALSQKKTSILAQVLSLKQGKNFAFIKSVIPSINNSILSTPILSILNLN